MRHFTSQHSAKIMFFGKVYCIYSINLESMTVKFRKRAIFERITRILRDKFLGITIVDNKVEMVNDMHDSMLLVSIIRCKTATYSI